ncbi:MAG: Crp/Fnr family transcriptional regulator [Rhizobacter sp.]|nr:Crp/Fnr family transcriptional regulator [Chlorobiales bacterium]
MLTQLRQTITKLVPLTRSDDVMLESIFTPHAFRKHDVLLGQGQYARELFFVNEGFLRAFLYQKGEEVTTHLVGAGTFLTSFGSFIGGAVSHETIHCLSEGTLLRLSHENLERLYARDAKWQFFGRKLMESSLLCKEQRTIELISLTAEQRYLNLLQHQPQLVAHVPVQHLASFIGIKPESLSRIRRNFLTNVKRKVAG